MRPLRSSILLAFLATLAASFAGTASAQTDQDITSDLFDPFFRYTETEHREFYQGAPDETVDPLTGTLHIVHTDVVLPGQAGLDLRIVRAYSSKIWGRTDDANSFIALAEHSVLGPGWSFHMGRLRNSYIGGTSCSAVYPVMDMPDGSSRVFYPTATGYISRDYWTLVNSCTLRDGSTGSCVWSTAGMRYEFAPTNAYNYGTYGISYTIWPATAIVDRYNNAISMQYVPGSPGAISAITDTYNRQIAFNYDLGSADGSRLLSMVAGERTYYYEYSVVTNNQRILSRVRPPSGPAFAYTYKTSGTPANNIWALSTLKNPHGGTTQYVYGEAQFYGGVPGTTVPFAVVSSKTQLDRDGSSLGTWNYYYQSENQGTDVCNKYNVTHIQRPDLLWDTYWMYGFGSVTTGTVWQVGLTFRVARGLGSQCLTEDGCGAGTAAGTELVTNTWSAGAAMSQAIYSAPGYGNCTNPLQDNQVLPSQLIQRTTRRDGNTWASFYYNYDGYGQPQGVLDTLAGYGNFSDPGRTTTWTYQYAPSINVVRGLPLTQRVCNENRSCFTNSWTYNPQGYYSKSSQTLSGVTSTFGYDQFYNVALITNALGQTLQLGGYSAGGGIPTTLTYNNAVTTSRTTTWEGWVSTQTDGNGNTSGHTYDKIGRVTSDTPPGASYPTSYTYAEDGSAMTATRGPYEKVTVYDGFGRVKSMTDNLGVHTSSLYDSMGRPAFRSYPYFGEVAVGDTSTYDGAGRVVSVTRGDGTFTGTTWNGSNFQTNLERNPQDELQTYFTYNAYGGPDGDKLLASVNDANNTLWQYRYNAAGKLTLSFTSGLKYQSRSFVYDANQFLKSMATPESGTVTFGRNAIGQATYRTDARGVTATFGYNDALGRLTSKTYNAGSPDDVNISYDNNGNVVTRSSVNGGTFVYAYDELNRLTAQSWALGVNTFTTSYSYDPSGCLSQMTYPTGSQVAMTCDSANRVTSISMNGTPIVTNVSYHPSGQISGMTYGNGLPTSIAYDNNARPTSVVSNGILGLSYGYDGADNVVSFDNSAVPNSGRTMEYDLLNRLIVSTAPYLWGTAAYDYDAFGNRTLNSPGSFTTSFAYDSNNHIQYAAGSVQLIAPISFTYDLAGRLVTSSDGASYAYDGTGRRIQKTANGIATLYHYDSKGRLISETQADGTKRDYIYLGGKLVAASGCISAGPPGCNERQWYHTDGLGSVLARTDPSGSVVARFDYAPWGEQWTVPAVQGARQYNGRVYDPGTGLHDYGARMYSPLLGRFLTADTVKPDLTNPATFNKYSYVLNNPHKYVDPTGNFFAPWHGMLTFSSMLLSGYDLSYSANIAWQNMKSDFNSYVPYTQDPDNANWHGMSSPHQSPSDAALGNAQFVHNQLSLGSDGGFGRAMHANEDPFAGGHGFTEWKGDYTFSHIFQDVFPSTSSLLAAFMSDMFLLNSGQTIQPSLPETQIPQQQGTLDYGGSELESPFDP